MVEGLLSSSGTLEIYISSEKKINKVVISRISKGGKVSSNISKISVLYR